MEFFTGMAYYLKGTFFFIKNPRLWKYVVFPVIVASVLMLVLGALAIWGYKVYLPSLLSTALMQKITASIWWQKVVVGIIFFIVASILFIILCNIMTDAFMDSLSAAVENLVLGKVQSAESPEGIFAGIIKFIRDLPEIIIGGCVLLILQLIPVLGQIIAYMAVSYANAKLSLEYTMARHGRSYKEMKTIFRGNKSILIGFGVVAVFLLIPPFTIISRPLSVIGGTLLALEKIEKLT